MCHPSQPGGAEETDPAAQPNRRVVEKDAYCVDILNQVAAIQAALTGFSRELLGQHIRTCVAQDMRQGKPEKTEELVQLLGQMIK